MKQIPGTLMFIDEQGVVSDGSGNIKKTYINSDNYRTVNVKMESGEWTTLSIHRLLALTFKQDRLPEQTQVNHIDGDKQNNQLDNLEWVTPLQNNIHSELFNRNNTRDFLLVTNTDGEFVGTFRNIYDAEKQLGLSANQIWASIKANQIAEGLVFHYLGFSHKKWPTLKTKVAPNLPACRIKMLDLETGLLCVFDSIGAAAKHFSTNPSHIYQSLQKSPSTVKLFRKRYMVAKITEPFFDYTETQILEARTRGEKATLSLNLDTGEIIIFRKAKDIISRYNLSKKAVTTSLLKCNLRIFQTNQGRMVFHYVTNEEIVVQIKLRLGIANLA